MSELPADADAEQVVESKPVPVAKAMLVVVTVTLLTMAPSCGHRFTSWDDTLTVSRNPNFNPPSASGVMNHWRKPHMDLYVPVTYTAWGVLARVAYDGPGRGLDPRVFHAFNVVLHAVNAGLALLLLRRLLGSNRAATWAAAAGALLFGVHPVQVEPVGWVSGTKDLLCGTFTLLALLAYVMAVRASAERIRWTPYALGTVALILAMLSKPTAVVVPAMALVVDRLIVGRAWRAVARSVLPWAVLAIPVVVLTKLVQPAAHVVDAPPIWMRPLVAGDALAFYLAKLALPWRLGIDYGRTPAVAIGAGWVYWTWMLPVGVAVALWFGRRRLRGVVAGALLALVPLLPVLGLVRFDFQRISTVADHYLYLPMFGVGVAVASMLCKVAPRRWVVPVGVVLLLLAVRSAAQTRHWRDDRSLAMRAVAVNPNSWVGHVNLAVALLDQGAGRAALPHAERAVQLRPNEARGHWVLGDAQLTNGLPVEAEASFRRAMELDPKEPTAPAALSMLLAQQGRAEEAIGLARKAIELDPSDAAARFHLGTMLLERGQIEEAVERLTAVVQSSPQDPRARTALGIAHARLGHPDEARRHLEEALRLDPKNVTASEELDKLAPPGAGRQFP